MQRVRGIGGIFFKAKDPAAQSAWYSKHLGVPIADWGGAVFKEDGAVTVWNPFKADTKYFAPSEASFMVNFRVDDLDAMLAQLREAGVEVLPDVQDSDEGKFGWLVDPEGNKIELWQPKG